jgi:hypothetical protein
VTLLLLMLFLRALPAPVYLLAASVLAVLATLGLTVVICGAVFGSPDLVYFVPFAAGVLLVSLGSDYNVFVVGRIWEEARALPTRGRGGRRGSARLAGDHHRGGRAGRQLRAARGDTAGTVPAAGDHDGRRGHAGFRSRPVVPCAGPSGTDRPFRDVARSSAGPRGRPEAARVVGREPLAQVVNVIARVTMAS